MKYYEESIQTVFDAMPMVREHYAEVGHYPDIELIIDEDQYRLLEEKGVLRTFVARADDGALMGYATFVVNINVRYQKSLQASQDVIFLHPKARGEGWKFISWCDDQLRESGVQVVYHHTKAKQSFGPTLERLGYELIDLVYGRRLDKEGK